MFVNRKSKSITQAMVFMAFRKAMELGGAVAGPKKLPARESQYGSPAFPASQGLADSNKNLNRTTDILWCECEIKRCKMNEHSEELCR